MKPLPRIVLTALITGLYSNVDAQDTAEAVVKKAETTIIPKLTITEATTAEALATVGKLSGIKVFPAPAAKLEGVITINLTNIPASEAFKYVTGLANLTFHYEADGVHVAPQKAEPKALFLNGGAVGQ